MAGINIRIKNTFEPEHDGTLISRNYVSQTSKVEIVSGSDKVLALEINDPMMVGETGFDLNIMQVFKKHEVSYIVKATDATCITTVVWDNSLVKALVDELKTTYYAVNVKPVALVCAIGSNIAQPGILGKAASALSSGNINIICFSQSMRQINMQFVIEREDYEKAIVVLNDALCFKK
jgi:aspartate kinase